jgi:Superinfection immunity protein
MTRFKELIGVLAFALVALLTFFGINNDNVSGALGLISVIIGSFAIYFLPTIVAMSRQHPAQVSILLLNLFLGWTLLGWVAALVWSAMPIKERHLTLIERDIIERRIADDLRI